MPRKKKSEVIEKVTSGIKSTVRDITDKLMEEITLLAYKYFEQRGYQHGQDLGDWLRAEKVVPILLNAASLREKEPLNALNL